ncbi:MAG TPA: putative quinol monooxygenase [Methylophilus sp.]|uniref:putative quinol monooxygenase n=1 Tax=Methylophilus sp. TaxID=29541 RepID=UPI002C98DEFA|nr:putative quinol monooxygenase [Methylophilus sp.]HSH85955.1 putative quinol monooxygenase [Methylophilus sp.]
MKKKLSLVAFIYAKPGYQDEVATTLKSLIELSRSEAGCINYDLHQSSDDPTVFVMYENWHDRSDLDHHFNMPYMQEIMKSLPEMLRAPVEMHYLDMLSHPNRQQLTEG